MPAADLAFMTELADRFAGRVRIKSLDFSNLLGWREALQATERLTAIADVMLVESPALRGDIDGLVEFRRRSRLPVSEHVHGQRHAWQLLHHGAVDILNLSPYVLGGIRPTIRAAALAEAAGASVLLGTTQELGLGTAAVAHVGAVLPALPFPADNVGPRLYTADVATPPVEFVDGHLVVPTGPGLGPVGRPVPARAPSLGTATGASGSTSRARSTGPCRRPPEQPARHPTTRKEHAT